MTYLKRISLLGLICSPALVLSPAGAYNSMCHSPIQLAALMSKPPKQESPIDSLRKKIRKKKKSINKLYKSLDKYEGELGDSLSLDDKYRVASQIRDYMESRQNGFDCAETSSLDGLKNGYFAYRVGQGFADPGFLRELRSAFFPNSPMLEILWRASFPFAFSKDLLNFNATNGDNEEIEKEGVLASGRSEVEVDASRIDDQKAQECKNGGGTYTKHISESYYCDCPGELFWSFQHKKCNCLEHRGFIKAGNNKCVKTKERIECDNKGLTFTNRTCQIGDTEGYPGARPIIETVPIPAKKPSPTTESEEPAPPAETATECEEEWQNHKAFQDKGRVSQSFCNQYAQDKNDCNRALKRMQSYVKKIAKAEKDLDDLQDDLEDKKDSTDSESQRKTEAGGICISCLKRVLDASRPTVGETIGNALNIVAGAGMGVLGYRIGRQSQMDLNMMRIRQGYEAQHDFYSFSGASAGFPFMAQGLHGLTRTNTPVGGWSCSPSMDPHGHRYNYQYGQGFNMLHY